jgi:hypothetical protein
MRIDRKRRRTSRGLTWLQEMELCHGIAPAGSQPFPDREAYAAAWRAHRDELMAAVKGPGRRPHAFYCVELNIVPTSWAEEVRALFERGLLPREEILAVEAYHQVLDPQRQADMNLIYDSETSIRAMQSDPYSLRRTAVEFEFASLFHGARGRPELAEIYARRAAAVRIVLEDE